MNSDSVTLLKPDIQFLDIEDQIKSTGPLPKKLTAGVLALLSFSIVTNPSISSNYLHSIEENSISVEKLGFSYEEDMSEPIIKMKTIANVKAKIVSISKLEII